MEIGWVSPALLSIHVSIISVLESAPVTAVVVMTWMALLPVSQMNTLFAFKTAEPPWGELNVANPAVTEGPTFEPGVSSVPAYRLIAGVPVGSFMA